MNKKLNKIIESNIDDIDKLVDIKEIGNLDFSKVFWVMKRIIIRQNERILKLEMDYEDLISKIDGDDDER